MRIVEDMKVSKYRVFRVDGEKPAFYNCYSIDGKVFRPVPTHGLRGYYAIESDEPILGKEVEFISA